MNTLTRPVTASMKLTTPLAIRHALDLCAEVANENLAVVMYKPDIADDDDYIGADMDEYASLADEGEFEHDFLSGRSNWELWVTFRG